MARITARQAQTRSRTRRENTRSRAKNAREEIRQNYLRQVAELRDRIRASQSSGADEMKPPAGPQDDDNDNDSANNWPAKIRLQKVSNTKKVSRRANHNNRKITDFFQIFSRSRENIPKSPPPLPPIIRPQSQGRLGPRIEPLISRNSTDIEVITISSDSDSSSQCDQDEEDEDDYSGDEDAYGHDAKQAESPDSPPSTHPNPDTLDCKPLIIPSDKFFARLNTSMAADDDLEIVDMLPPISLRDHPVVDLEGGN